MPNRFTALPREICFEIASHLPTVDAFSARRAGRLYPSSTAINSGLPDLGLVLTVVGYLSLASGTSHLTGDGYIIAPTRPIAMRACKTEKGSGS